ncbi:hypothetical protein E2C01_077115 [Portunus trituberculatus]|uniref:Uncharacterized protein n=1 Tax=Portunus trituberculatus TaxID=210409 RepID=A0A5B7ILC5_PORTR|nr:hypothetical protein [Portunus trituberculatus]
MEGKQMWKGIHTKGSHRNTREVETFSEVTAGFNDKFIALPEPKLLDLTGKSHFPITLAYDTRNQEHPF